MDKQDIVVITFLLLTIIYFWTLPFQNNPLPFGEGDSAWHFAIGHYIATQDQSIARLPDYIGFWYYNFNPALGPNALEYLPPNHINYAFAEIFGGLGAVPVNIYRAITSALASIAAYFLVRKLYGILPAIITATGTMFGITSIGSYIFGQHPTLLAIVITPAVLYAAYKYLSSFYAGKEKVIYLYMLSFLIMTQWLLHIQGIFSILMVGAFAILMIIKYKKLPISKNNLVHAGLLIVIFIAVVAPFWLIYFGLQSDFSSETRAPISRLLQWEVPSSIQQGNYPEWFFDTGAIYAPLSIFFMLIAVVYFLLRRTDKDLLMLGWIIGVYITLHLDVFIGASGPRIARMIPYQTPLMFSLIGIGAVYLPNLVSSIFKLTKNAKTTASLVFFAIAFFSVASNIAAAPVDQIGISRTQFLQLTYQAPMRISPVQVEAADWIRANLEESDTLRAYGTTRQSYPIMRYIYALSGHYIEHSDVGFTQRNSSPSHYFFDYSFLTSTGNGAEIQKVLGIEQQIQNTSTMIYENSQGTIRIYEINEWVPPNAN